MRRGREWEREEGKVGNGMADLSPVARASRLRFPVGRTAVSANSGWTAVSAICPVGRPSLAAINPR